MNLHITKQVSDHLEMMEQLCKIGSLDISYYNRCLDFCNLIYDRDKVNDLNIEKLIKNDSIQSLLVYQIFKDESQLIDPEGLTPFVFENLEILKEKSDVD